MIADDVRGGDEMRNCLNDILNENGLLTLAQINQELGQRLSRKTKLAIHDRTVARTLEGMLHRVKLANPAEGNRPDFLKRVDSVSQLVHAECCSESWCICRQVWIHYLDGKSRTSKYWREGILTSMDSFFTRHFSEERLDKDLVIF